MNGGTEHNVGVLPVPLESPVDLTLAFKVLHELAYRDGDLGAAYWNSVIRLLERSGSLHAEVLDLRRQLLSA